MLATLSAWWLNLSGIGFFSLVHLLGALALILALTLAELLWAVHPTRKWWASSPQPPAPNGRTRAPRLAASCRHAVAGVHR